MIVITGATGNVGRPLVQTLTAAGEDVVPVSRRGEGHQADLTKPETLEPVLMQYRKDHPAPPPQPLPICKG